jgi:hypothetical protein
MQSPCLPDGRKEGGSLSTHLPQNWVSRTQVVVYEVDNAYPFNDAAAFELLL